MHRRITAVAACSVITLLSLPALGQDEPLQVVASFSIIGDLAQQVGGDHIALKTLVGPNGDSHVYEPKPADAMALARADVVLTNGLEFEGFMRRLIEASATDAAIVTVTEGVETREEPGGGHYHFIDGEAIFHAGAHDPHAWQSVANTAMYVDNIRDAFCAADSADCADYEANAARYKVKLEALDADIHAAIDALPEDARTVVVAHNAFGYFEAAYGIHFLSPQGVSTESEASAADVAGLITRMRETGAGAIFSENISDSRLVEQIASEADMELGGVLFSDALSDAEGPASSYIEMMRHNTATITTALSAE